MADFPSIKAPSYGLQGETYLPQVKNEFEANYVQSRPRATRAVERWNLGWEALPEADFQTLRTFFVANQGGLFTWTHPVTSTVYTCRFSGNGLKYSFAYPGHRRVECPIEEA